MGTSVRYFTRKGTDAETDAVRSAVPPNLARMWYVPRFEGL